MAPASSADRTAALLAGLRRFVDDAAPVVRRLGAALGRGARGLLALAGRHRAGLALVSHRVMWWSAVLLLVVGGRPVLGQGPLPERTWALAPFVAGLLLCGAVRLFAAARHLRIGALGLGAVHAVALVLVWTAFDG